MNSLMRLHRKANNVPRESVAQVAHVSEQHFREIEELRRRPSPALGHALERIFRMPLGKLLTPVRSVGGWSIWDDEDDDDE